MAASDLEILFTSARLGAIELRNRFVMPAMQRGFVESYAPTATMAENLARCGEGGVALICSESCAIDHPSAYWLPTFCHLAPSNEDAWRRVIDSVKATGARFFFQLWHPGAQREVGAISELADQLSLSPSGYIQAGRPNGKAATATDLTELKDAYVVAACRAQYLGADGIELHAAHGYLLDSFFWRETNARDDGYGGSTLVERARFPLEVVAAIRKAVGTNFPISLRFSQFKGIDYEASIASDPDELAVFLTAFDAAGVDAFNASTRQFHKSEWPDIEPDLALAGWTKRLSRLPVIGCGSVGLETDLFESLLDDAVSGSRASADLRAVAGKIERNEMDFIAIGRGHIANHDFVTKVRTGRIGEIIPFRRSVHLPT